ncbi:hypothetical protein OG426_30545 [Streptomyces canus]|uniref:hypothetical protein n=1 Tax=Streptomyces canus TaxID=58343 RepID=UPI00386AEEE0|nr:hypothetical protein OG426_30545 [Streptomyces canus]
MGEQSSAEVATATLPDGSWKMKVTHEDGKTIAEVWSFGVRLSITTLTAEGVVSVEDPASGPAVHRFASTREAYDATQCRDDIRDGDVLVVESERVIGILDAAWPVAITEAHVEFHGLKIPAGEHKGGRYTASAELAEKIAAELGFPLAAKHARAA